MTNKIEEQDFQSVMGRWFKCGVLIELALIVHAIDFYK